MITKGVIKELNSNEDNHYRVYIPYLRKANDNEDDATLLATRIETPGVTDDLNVGDAVFVAFEDGSFEKPTILGKLFTGKEETRVSDRGPNLSVKSIECVGSSNLSSDTKIGELSLKDISDKTNNIYDSALKLDNLVKDNKWNFNETLKLIDSSEEKPALELTRLNPYFDENTTHYKQPIIWSEDGYLNKETNLYHPTIATNSHLYVDGDLNIGGVLNIDGKYFKANYNATGGPYTYTLPTKSGTVVLSSDIDDKLNTNSTNAVQNKVITTELLQNTPHRVAAELNPCWDFITSMEEQFTNVPTHQVQNSPTPTVNGQIGVSIWKNKFSGKLKAELEFVVDTSVTLVPKEVKFALQTLFVKWYIPYMYIEEVSPKVWNLLKSYKFLTNSPTVSVASKSLQVKTTYNLNGNGVAIAHPATNQYGISVFGVVAEIDDYYKGNLEINGWDIQITVYQN